MQAWLGTEKRATLIQLVDKWRKVMLARMSEMQAFRSIHSTATYSFRFAADVAFLLLHGGR